MSTDPQRLPLFDDRAEFFRRFSTEDAAHIRAELATKVSAYLRDRREPPSAAWEQFFRESLKSSDLDVLFDVGHALPAAFRPDVHPRQKHSLLSVLSALLSSSGPWIMVGLFLLFFAVQQLREPPEVKPRERPRETQPSTGSSPPPPSPPSPSPAPPVSEPPAPPPHRTPVDPQPPAETPRPHRPPSRPPAPPKPAAEPSPDGLRLSADTVGVAPAIPAAEVDEAPSCAQRPLGKAPRPRRRRR